MWTACRDVSPLEPFTEYVACVVARDTAGNVQFDVTALQFSTTDTDAPVTAARVQPDSLTNTLVAATCGFTLEVNVNEPANSTYIVFPVGSNTTVPSAKNIFEAATSSYLPEQPLAQGLITTAVGQQGMYMSAEIQSIPCGSALLVRSFRLFGLVACARHGHTCGARLVGIQLSSVPSCAGLGRHSRSVWELWCKACHIGSEHARCHWPRLRSQHTTVTRCSACGG